MTSAETSRNKKKTNKNAHLIGSELFEDNRNDYNVMKRN